MLTTSECMERGDRVLGQRLGVAAILRQCGRVGHRLRSHGSNRGLSVNLEECSGCGVDGWGWRDNGWGTSPAPPGTMIYFAGSGTHTLRVQTREDGVSFDQIVISADVYLDAPPGPAKRDNTIFE